MQKQEIQILLREIFPKEHAHEGTIEQLSLIFLASMREDVVVDSRFSDAGCVLVGNLRIMRMMDDMKVESSRPCECIMVEGANL